MVLVGLAPQQVGRKFLIPSLMMRNQEVPVEESAQTHPCSEEGPVYHLSRATYRALFVTRQRSTPSLLVPATLHRFIVIDVAG